MAISKTAICNLAISWLGGESIISINDDTTAANLCKANYEASRKAVLEEREWTFAVKRRVLTPLAQEPVFGFEYSFQLPSDVLRIIAVYRTSSRGSRRAEFIREGKNISLNQDTAYIRYLADITSSEEFSSIFDQTLAAHIAANIAVALTENAAQQERMMGLYERNLEKAISTDSLQGSREMLETSELEDVRRMHTRIR